ncbi:MAG: FtsX-like permease family protein [Lachnospiraceae bacterium]|nr:FtsX-like permease family protein [Lachnospiraceae bacterium]
MEMMFTLTLKTLKQNKKRTLLTVFTIILSVGMMTAVLCGGWSMLRFLQEKEKIYGGDYAYSIEITSKQQAENLLQEKNVEDVSLLRFAGSSFYGEPSNKTLLAVAEINDAFVENFSLEQYLLEGRFPLNENEIILTQEFIDDNGLSFSVGDTIQLSLGMRVWDEINTELYGFINFLGERESFHLNADRTYTIVGIVSEMNESKVGSEFNAYSGMRDDGSALSAFVKCNHISKSVYSEAEENAKAASGQVSAFHSTLLLYHGVTGGKGAVKILAAVMAVILLLMTACSAMISNVLSISLQERIKQLGMLASIGATGKQKKASVIMEAFLLGTIGIPFGLLFGLGLTVAVLAMIRISFETAFTFATIELHIYIHWLILLLGAISGIGSLFFACRTPGRIASQVTVIDTLKQTNVYHIKRKKIPHGRVMSVFFGIYGALASKNIYRNPKRFRAITMSIFLAVVLGLSLYSFSDFMLYQTSMDMKEDGSSYTDVEAAIPYKDLPTAVRTISDAGVSADISYRISRYMTAEFEEEMINPDMAGYFINGSLAELYVVGMDEEHLHALCEENNIDYAAYDGKSNHGMLINSATGNYGTSSNRVVIGSPFLLESGSEIELEYSDISKTVIVQDVVNGNNAAIQSQFVRDRAVLIVPMSYFDWLLSDDTYIELAIGTSQHEQVTECLADMGFFQVFDVAKTTENSRQIYILLKMMVCIFTVLMTMIIGLNVCNTIANTINVRRNEFAVLRSVGMTPTGLKKMLLLESALYGVKSLILALPISLIIHYVMYSLISKGMTPFMFYINLGVYGIALIVVTLVVVMAMLFSLRSVEKVEIVKELKTGSY